MTESEELEILTTFKDCILADPLLEIGPIVDNPSPESDYSPIFGCFLTRWNQPGIWIRVAGEWAYLGSSFESALFTAQLSDWWFPNRDGELLRDDIDWFETRSSLGDSWEYWELPMFREERRMRLAQNISLATDDNFSDRQEG